MIVEHCCVVSRGAACWSVVRGALRPARPTTCVVFLAKSARSGPGERSAARLATAVRRLSGD